VLVVVVFRLLRLPPLLGYLLVGILIGPHALGWLPEAKETSHLAEFGVVFLMFSIGLEFSLSKLLTMKRLVFGLGSAQVVVTLLLVMLGALLAGLDWRAGLALGGALAMSSTAIVSKMLAEKSELNSLHGRQVIGVLLFQDLAVVPLLILVPALAQSTGGEGADTLAVTLTAALVNASLVLVVILFLGQRLMRPWFHLVAAQKSSELFMLNILLITLGLAWITEIAGLSLALGAFLAGMLISETEYRYQVEEDIKPFRDVLLGLFFVTIGMMLDLHIVAANFAWVALLLVLLVAAKALLVMALAKGFGSEPGAAIRTGLHLGQAGEFGFVLLAQAGTFQVVDAPSLQTVLAAMVLSMLAAPFVIQRSEKLARRFSAAEWMHQALALTTLAAQTMHEEGHVVICGYGRSGQNLSRLLEREAIPFIALDFDPQRIREAAAAGESVVFGDAAKREVLIAAGLMRARALVISYADTASALRILSNALALRPDLPVIVRTLDDSDIDKLKRAGAAEVVSEIMEGSLMLASHALMLLGTPLNRVLKHIREAREERYGLFRGFYRGITDDAADGGEKAQMRLQGVFIAHGAAAIGMTLGELGLADMAVEVTAVRRRNIRGLAPSDDTRLQQGDVVVLRGNAENLAAAEIKLMQG